MTEVFFSTAKKYDEIYFSQATDKGGKYTQTIVEVVVVPGPNTKSPIFQQPVYDVVVSEGVAVNTTVTSVYVSLLLANDYSRYGRRTQLYSSKINNAKRNESRTN